MNDHRNADSNPDCDTAANTALPKHDRDEASDRAETVPHEPDFSRLRMARASLDEAFAER